MKSGLHPAGVPALLLLLCIGSPLVLQPATAGDICKYRQIGPAGNFDSVQYHVRSDYWNDGPAWYGTLTKIDVHHGDYVDSLTFHYEGTDPKTHGGKGGAAFDSITLSPGEYITGIEGLKGDVPDLGRPASSLNYFHAIAHLRFTTNHGNRWPKVNFEDGYGSDVPYLREYFNLSGRATAGFLGGDSRGYYQTDDYRKICAIGFYEAPLAS